MKFNRTHLIGSVVLLLASILYNVWVFWGSSAAKKGAKAGTPAAVAGTAGVSTAIDPQTLPAPPPIDLNVAPAWDRDPFRRAGAVPSKPEAVLAAVAPKAVEADPVVGAILFSPERKLAIVNGKIVAVGDRLPSGIVSDITRDAILVRDSSGDERRYVLRGGKNKREVAQ